jgi:hypothetical protein
LAYEIKLSTPSLGITLRRRNLAEARGLRLSTPSLGITTMRAKS